MPQAANTEESSTNDVHIDQQALERSEKVLDTLFGVPEEEDAPVVGSAVVDPPVADDAVASEEEEESTDEDSANEDVDDDAEVDWDDLPSSKKDDDAPADESAARKQAKLKGREAKELQAKLTERELELDRIRQEREDLQARLDEVESTRIRPEDHPDFVDLRDSILSDVEQGSELLPVPDPQAVVDNFGPFMAEYLKFDATKGADRTAARVELKGIIVDKLKLSEVPYADLDEDERRAFDVSTTEVIKIIQRNVGKTRELQKLNSTLTEKAKTGHLSVGVKAYESTVSEFKPVLAAIGDMADDVIEADPHAVEAIVAKMVKSSPENKRLLEKAKADVLEAMVGPRALTQIEIDKLEANGTNVKQFMAERAKAHRAKQMKLAAKFVQGLMTRSLLKETSAKLSKYETETDAEESEFDALRTAAKKKGTVKPPEIRPKDRPSPLSKLFGHDDE